LDDQSNCAWLDVYGGISPGSLGLARPKENEIPFMFKDDQGNTTFRPDFLYDPKNESWRIMDAR